MTYNSVANNPVIQSLLSKADELTNVQFDANSSVTVLGQEQSTSFGGFDTNYTTSANSFNQSGVKIEEVDDATANQIIQSLSSPSLTSQYGSVDVGASNNATVVEEVSSALTSTTNYNSNLYQDPNGPQIIRRPAAQGPLTYRQNISVRFLQPPPAPSPGPLIIKEVRPPQPPPPPPLVIRQHAPPRPQPPPLVLRERPPQVPTPIPTQTVIRKLPPTPPPPRSIIVERYPAVPARPRDIVIERWLPYSKETQKRKVITYRAPPPPSYPQPRNTIIVYEPVQVNVLRQIHRLGVQPQNPQEYIAQYGYNLLDSASLLAQTQQIGINDNLSPSIDSANQVYQTDASNDYYVSSTQTVWEPEYDYNTTTIETQRATNSEQPEVYWTDPQEDIRAILQRLGIPLE
ncbi:unnamed protein product [Adineta ricciae]|uniref:Uncharacterized protein n=1 Tax=Adineta ricciae TaxID=249248 RepID=A0A814QTJ9_ADIRI|nr:unnamed protein product [Adineta ricciae]CAF1124080.1 unnamed protein product [Adineta ricciae]